MQAGRPIAIRHVVVRDTSRSRADLPAGITPSNSIEDALADPDTQLVVQLIGGTTTARDYALKFLKGGKDLITANKALLYTDGDTLFHEANQHGQSIGFEAAVAGGIPIIAALTQSLTANGIQSIEAILNGTSNFILTQMLDHLQPYAEVLQEAQRLGYAEADPAMDVDGTDAAQKLAILTKLAFSTTVNLSDIVQQGIDVLELQDLQTAQELGYKIKLLASARLQPEGLELSVQPTLLPVDSPVAQIDGADNIVAVTGDAVGRTAYSGAGAGQLPTASAVVADIVDYATGRGPATFASVLRALEQPRNLVQPPEQLRRRYYLRMTVDDQPHVLADIADVLGKNDISISSIRQDETSDDDETARLVIMTHHTTEGQLRSVDAMLDKLGSIRNQSLRLPVAA